MSVEKLESHLGRLVVTHVVPDRYADFDIDIVLFRQVVLLIDVNKEQVVLIRNEVIVQALQCMFEAIRDNARTVDLNDYIRGLIGRKTDRAD